MRKMSTIKKTFSVVVLLIALFAIFASPAFAALDTDLNELQDRVLDIAIPISGVILIYAGIMMMQGNGEAVRNALIGLVFVYAAAGIVIFISSIFG